MSQPKMEDSVWTEELEDKLIELWRKNECLYNISAKSYSNRNKKRAVMKSIATELKLTGNLISFHLARIE